MPSVDSKLSKRTVKLFDLLDPLCAEYESLEDRIAGPRPDHCVVVLSCDPDSDEVVCYDPSSGEIPVSIPVSAFLDAWKDSENYMVTVGKL